MPVISNRSYFGVWKIGANGKSRIQIPGPHASLRVNDVPVFYYRSDPERDRAGTLAVTLVVLKSRKNLREVEEASASAVGKGNVGAAQASLGIPVKYQVQTQITRHGDTYRLVPGIDLKPGEYAFYLRTWGERSQESFLYDFSVPDDSK